MLVKTLEDLKKAMELETETERVEFKAATGKHDLAEIAKYCAALANEGGGSFILGVTNKKPRKAVGVGQRPNIDDDKKNLFDWIGMRVEVYEIQAPSLVLSYVVRGRPLGRAVSCRGRYLIRAGSHLRDMTWDELDRIRNEGKADFSSNVIVSANIDVFDPKLIEKFRRGWIKKQSKEPISAIIPSWSVEQLLETGGLTIDGQPTYAGLVMVGTEKALNHHLPQSELIFEFRDSQGSIRYADRRAIRCGFVQAADDVWGEVAKRNSRVTYSEGFFKYELPSFDEDSVREAVCNAVSHREYRHEGSVFIRQGPHTIEVESPGGLPNGVTIDNILEKSVPRNRRLAEVMDRCGLVERSGQGMDMMFGRCIMYARPIPDLSDSDESRVVLRLRSEVTDPKIIAFFERISAETLKTFSGLDFLAVDLVRRGQPFPNDVVRRLPRLVELGILEKAKKKYVLSEQITAQIGVASAQDADRHKIRERLEERGAAGISIGELMQMLGREREQVRWMLNELKRDGLAASKGQGRGAKWYSIKIGALSS